MINFRYTSGVRKHTKTILSFRIGQKIKPQTVVHVFIKY